MNTIHGILLRTLAAGLIIAPITTSALLAQEATAEQGAPASAVSLIEGAAPSGEALEVAPAPATSLVEVAPANEPIIPQGDSSLDPVDPAFVTEVGAEEAINEVVQTIEVPSLIEDATGIEDFSYGDIFGESGEFKDSNFFEPVVTTPTPNALVKDKATTPDIYRAIKDILMDEEFPLSAEEKSAILSTYFDRKGELIFITDDKRMSAVETARDHVQQQGLPKSRYEFSFPSVFDPIQKMAMAEIEGAAFVVKYGKDMERGIVAPNSLGNQFDIVPKGRTEHELLTDFANAKNDEEFFMALEPNDPDYATLKAELAKYEALYMAAETAHVPSVPDQVTLKLGSQGEAVKILRQRLAVLGFEAQYEPVIEVEADPEVNADVIAAIAQEVTGENVVTQAVETVVEQPKPQEDVFDAELVEAVRAYQAKAGLLADGVAGPRTLKTINGGPRAQMEPYLIAMERHRWGDEDRSGRQIYVNLASYMAEVRDDNVKTFETRVVIGKNAPAYKTPEFHDEMEYLVINPEWNVPHSIGTKEFLPIYQRGGSLNSTYKMLNSRGQKVNTANVNFNKYTAKTFPYRFVQENGPKNALGNVKFIFPNRHNIYLHDTPAKSLFGHNNRAYSHGCVRVADPIDLATHLMAPYYKNPRASYDQIRSTKKQRFVEMTTKIPVFLTYFTTYVDDTGEIHRVRDVYNRDRLVKNALAEQGVIF